MSVPSPGRQRLPSSASEQRPLLGEGVPTHSAPTDQDNFDLPDRLIGKRALTAILDCSYTTIWKWCVEGKFVKAIDCNGIPKWRLSEVMEWIETRERRRFKGDPPEQIAS
jgi:predicted DNA-binding transcriptional regulator AlpA